MTPEEKAHKLTDETLEKLEKEVAKVYNQTGKELEEKVNSYMEQFKKFDEIKLKQLAEDKITQKQYEQWKIEELILPKKWNELRENIAEYFTNANKIAAKIMGDTAKDVYALNHNYASYAIEKGTNMNLNFSLYDKATVERLLKDNKQLLPQPKIDIAKDLKWNNQKIQSSILQGILQGEPINDIAKRLKTVTDMNKSSAIRNARTAITGAENAGRQDTYKDAAAKGIKLKKEWLATLDNDTRETHRELDGEQVEQDAKFSNGLEYPGDPTGKPSEIYNCRCTVIAVVEGVENVEPVLRKDHISGKIISNMSYKEWVGAKSEH